MFDYNY